LCEGRGIEEDVDEWRTEEIKVKKDKIKEQGNER
jgi:hypothetical protein